jgi:hypothetical protein
MQTSSYSKININLSIINSLSYLHANSHKISGFSYLGIAAIQNDVHPAGENSINTSHAYCARSAYDSRPYVSHAVHI